MNKKTVKVKARYCTLLFNRAEIKILWKALKYDIEENGSTKTKENLLEQLEHDGQF